MAAKRKPDSEKHPQNRDASGKSRTNGDELDGAEFATGREPVAKETSRDLQRINRELEVRVRELEMQMSGGANADGGGDVDPADAAEESVGIIAMIKDLHSEIDVAYELKEALEADLNVTRDKLAEEEAFRAELETRMKLLEAKAALGEQLREDIAFVEEERNETARRLEEVTSELNKTTESRDALAEQDRANEIKIKNLESDKISLQAKVLNLEEAVEEMDRLREELGETRERVERVEESERNLKGKLEASEVAKNALDLDLTTTRELLANREEQLKESNDELAATQTSLEDVRARSERQQAENASLVEANSRAEREIKSLAAQLEATKKDLESNKKALRDIHNATAKTASRIRERYSGT